MGYGVGEWIIDGAHGEGGGQLVRLAAALAALTQRVTRIVNIRARRAKPGLAAQHLAALRAVAALCGGTLTGAELGAREVHFRPGPIRAGRYRFEVGTAGSVTLVLQALLPVALQAEGPCRVTLTGGTDVARAPPMDYLRVVLLPWLAQMGAEVHIVALHRGYYPRGGGELTLDIVPCRTLRPLLVESAGALRRITGHAHVAHLPRHIAERMAAAASNALVDLAPVETTVAVLDDAAATGMGGALTLVAETNHARLGAAVVAQRGVPAERLGAEAAQALRQDLASGAALDVHAADQLLIYAALAAGDSLFSVRALSSHAETAMWLIAQCLPVRFAVEAQAGRQLVRVHHVR
ncbi:MAG: RNA 3'-terminal phosphate cyclase [Thiobacillaceae bacterium]|nr:RNA 3'-terminal phosphate cyclase [Thiobacillaceae bacterium]MCX7672275.1 RNA 3'-terminal phosphate cyclase [Thiobacillaceae bacterium]